MIAKYFNLFDKSSLDTKIILLIVFFVMIALLWKIINILKEGLKPKNLLSFLTRIIKIVIPLETKTIAGIINLMLTLGLLIVTILLATANSLSNLIGFKENIAINILLSILLTIIVGLISLWALYKFYKESNAINSA